jgi:hypothetical protein
MKCIAFAVGKTGGKYAQPFDIYFEVHGLIGI